MFDMFFAPAMAIMDRLRFVLKLGLVGLLFLVPLAGLLIHLYDRLNADIQTAKDERAGVQLVMSARSLLQAVQAYRATSFFASAQDPLSSSQSSEIKDKLSGLSLAVDDKLRALSTADQIEKLGTEVLSKLQRQWPELKSDHTRERIEAKFEKQSTFVKLIQEYMALVSDKSGLTLDPLMDSYYLMDAAIFRSPAAIENIEILRAVGMGILARQVITPEEKTRAAVLRSLFENSFDNVQSDLTKAIDANSALSGPLKAKTLEARENGSRFFENDASLLAKGELAIAPSKFSEHAMTAANSFYGLLDVTLTQLDSLLASRIDRLKNDLHVSSHRPKRLLRADNLLCG